MYTIIGRTDCKWCEKALELLREKNLSACYHTVEENKWIVTLMLLAGYSTVPLIFGPDNRVIGGYTALEALFKEGPL